MIPDFVFRIRAVQQERGARLGRPENIVTLEKIKLMYGDEVCALNQVGALYRVSNKPLLLSWIIPTRHKATDMPIQKRSIRLRRLALQSILHE